MERFAQFIAGEMMLYLFGGVVVFTIIRVIYKALRDSLRKEPQKASRSIADMYDPLTGLPRDIVANGAMTEYAEEQQMKTIESKESSAIADLFKEEK